MADTKSKAKETTTDFNQNWDEVDEVRKGFATFKFEDHGDTFVGIYQGPTEIANDEGEILEAFLFENEEGIPVGIWKAFDLERKLEEVPTGSLVRIEYRSDIQTKRGLNPMKEFKLQYKY